jgi:hypothetical protein
MLIAVAGEMTTMFSASMTSGLAELVGKTITGVIVKEGGAGPRGQLFLVCSDNTYYEFFSGYAPIEGMGHMVEGGAEDVKACLDAADISCEVIDSVRSTRPTWAR